MTHKKEDPPAKFDRNGWPEELVIPTVGEFLHGDWVRLGKEATRKFNSLLTPYGGDYLGYTEAKSGALDIPANYHCGTKCCLVGWMGVAFNGPWTPDMDKDMTPAHRKFMTEFLVLCGDKRNILNNMDNDDLMWRASNTFEGEIEAGPAKKMSARMAQKLWKEAARKCGYEVE